MVVVFVEGVVPVVNKVNSTADKIVAAKISLKTQAPNLSAQNIDLNLAVRILVGKNGYTFVNMVRNGEAVKERRGKALMC